MKKRKKKIEAETGAEINIKREADHTEKAEEVGLKIIKDEAAAEAAITKEEIIVKKKKIL